MSSLKSTIEKIKELEAQKASLLLEIEELRKIADAKATALESEVGALREEVTSIRILVGQPDLTPTSSTPVKMSELAAAKV